MKISYRTQPHVRLADHPDLLSEDVTPDIINFCNRFKTETAYFFASSFLTAAFDHINKIVRPSTLLHLDNQKLKYITRAYIFFAEIIHIREENKIIVDFVKASGTKVYMSENFAFEYLIDDDDSRFVYEDNDAAMHSFALVCLFLFKQFANVETKVLTANKRTKVHGSKYVNDTDVDITYLDCTWWTNLIRSEGFDVKGHVRLQPKKKDGEWTKEMIYIKPFKKHGYTRKAGILNEKAA